MSVPGVLRPEEQIAQNYLRGLGIGTPIYEPDGNMPPDFVINGRIAVEVRRFNQHFVEDGHVEPLETQDYRVSPIIEKILPTFDEFYTEQTFFVMLEFWRQVPPPKELQRLIRTTLKKFLTDKPVAPITLPVCDNVSLYFFPANPPSPGELFVLGAVNDHDQLGFIVSMYIENLKICIEKKEQKVAEYRDKYTDWWLLLIDTTQGDLAPKDVAEVKRHLPTTIFKKIILIDRDLRVLLEV